MFRASIVPASPRHEVGEMGPEKDHHPKKSSAQRTPSARRFLMLMLMATLAIGGVGWLAISASGVIAEGNLRGTLVSAKPRSEGKKMLVVNEVENQDQESLHPDEHKPLSAGNEVPVDEVDDQDQVSLQPDLPVDEVEDQDLESLQPDQHKPLSAVNEALVVDKAGDQVSLQPDERASKRFAYLFYVTSDIYACAAMQFIHRLTDNLQMNSSRIDVVVMHTSHVREHLLLRMQTDHDVRPILVDPLYADVGDPTWRESLTKLRAFQDWGYERVVFLDADAVPMANLDHLFDLPKAPLYAPTAYWLEQPFFASTVLVIEPSETTFNGIVKWAHDRGAAAGFDMDILNAYFAESVQHLSGVYTVLNSDFRQAPSARNKLFDTTTELKEHVQVVHFSCKPDGSYGKPWNWPTHDLSLLEGKDFEPLFGELFVEFWHGEKTLCAS